MQRQNPATAISKPPYRVPLLSEIEQIPPNGYTVASTFSGCGGSCLGFRMAGFRIGYASEFIPEAQATYRANHPTTPLDTRDIRQVQPDDILEVLGMQRGELDVLEGSPPCASFSTAGKRASGWGKVKDYSDTRQRVDDLFFEYVRLLDGLQPRAFVAENVSGLVKGVAKGYFLEVLAALKGAGYDVRAKVLDAQWLGVPQQRQRLIFVGVRSDLAVEPAFPKPLPYRYSVRDALPEILRVKHGGRPDNWKSPSRPSPVVVASGAEISPTGYFSGSYVEAPVRAYRDNRGAHGNGGDCTDKPSPTILAGSVGTHWIEPAVGLKRGTRSIAEPAPTILTHGREHTNSEVTLAEGTERRKFTIPELIRICAFPDDFVLTGTYAQQWERLGRAVPPVMVRAVAEVVRDQILDKLS